MNLFCLFLLTICWFPLNSQAQDLIGGSIAAPGDFPEILYISAGRSRCTATAIGPRTILTAAHCVEDGGTIQPVSFSYNQTVFRASCSQSELYRDKVEDHDIALCKTDRELSYFASVDTSQGPYLGDSITLAGFGCTKPGGSGGNDGLLRWGSAPVIKLPYGTDNWFHTQGESALCFGDSGGPAFRSIKNPKKDPHFVAGVNSRGNIKDLSLLTALWIGKSISFMLQFEQKNQVEICGISRSCEWRAIIIPDPR